MNAHITCLWYDGLYMTIHVHLYEDIRRLRKAGFTFQEINQELGVTIPKSSLSYICRNIELSPSQIEVIQERHKQQLGRQRQKAVIRNKQLFDEKVASYKFRNRDFANFIMRKDAKTLALAMLYLGEGAKWKSRRGPQLGSSDPKILRLYVLLLRDCYGVTPDKMRCRVQHRADQNAAELVTYWSSVTGIKPEYFYPSYFDKRTVGHKTKKKDYKGVCVVTCAGTYIQLELEQIAGIIFEAL